MTTTPLNTDAIAEALWGIAAAITESKPKAPQPTPHPSDLRGDAAAYGPIVNPDAFRPALELLPIGAVAELDIPTVLDGPEAGSWGIFTSPKIVRVTKHSHPPSPTDGSAFLFYEPDSEAPWYGDARLVLEMGLSARDFSVPQEELEVDEVEDMVNEPSHYRQEDGLECIDFSYDLPGPWFSVVRYVWRCLDKGNPVQDLEKALRYIQIADERGVKKPRNGQHYGTFLDLWLRENDDPIAEARYYALTKIFDERASVDSETVRRIIEALLDRIKEKA